MDHAHDCYGVKMIDVWQCDISVETSPRVLSRRRSWRAFRFMKLLLLICCLPMVVSVGDKNPYHVLGLGRETAQKDIEKRYKTLCLQYHPDKNVHRSTSERQKFEEKFKEVQHAYSQIGTEEARRTYERQERYGIFAGSEGTTASSSRSSFSGDPDIAAFFNSFAHSPPNFYFSRGADGRPRFGVRRSYPSAGTAAGFGPTSMSFRSIYKQKVQVPLEQLYTGTTVNFELVDNIWTRWRAAIRGKSIYISLYQGLLYSMPMIRTSKIVAAIVGLVIVHATLPKPDPSNTYVSKLPKGVKGDKTKVRFQPPRIGEPEVIFEVVEAPHPRYERVGDDLHTRVTIRPGEAQRGCTKRVPSLDETNDAMIVVEIPPDTKQGQEIRIRGEGWPLRNADLHGDLIIHVNIMRDKQNKKNKRGKRWSQGSKKRRRGW